jgi:hypothetical protein
MDPYECHRQADIKIRTTAPDAILKVLSSARQAVVTRLPITDSAIHGSLTNVEKRLGSLTRWVTGDLLPGRARLVSHDSYIEGQFQRNTIDRADIQKDVY